MSVSPRPARRNNIARSPSPATNATVNSNHLNANLLNANGSYLNPRNSELYRSRRSTNNSETESIPLMDANQPPLAHPEMDDIKGTETKNPQPEFDNNFLSSRANEEGLTIPTGISENGLSSMDNDGDESDRGRNHPNRRRPLSPSNRGDGYPDFDLASVIPELVAESLPDINVYQHKKTLAQGMMDLALFSANANQLRYVLDADTHPYYYSGVILISISLLFQVAIGVGLIWNSRYNVKDDREICIANKINNFTVIGIFLVTVINVFISAFGVASVQTTVPSVPVGPV